MNKVEFEIILPQIMTQEVSVDPDNWTVENCFWGTCVPVALLAQDLFGGDVLRSALDPTVYNTNSHYWNLLPDNEEYDFSGTQFQGSRPALTGERRTRAYLLANPQVEKRYHLLKSLFDDFVANSL